jgi:hypothetical protein
VTVTNDAIEQTAADFSSQLGAALATLTDAIAVKMCNGALNKGTQSWIASALRP